MRLFRAARVALAAAVLVMLFPGDAHAFAHIEGGGYLSGGQAVFSPGLTPTGTAPQTITLSTHGFGAAWALIYADALTWDCDFTISNVNLGAETHAAGVGEAVGGCIGYPVTGVLTTGTMRIECPLLPLAPMVYTRVGTVVTLNGVCLGDWAGVADIADVTMVMHLLPPVPDPSAPDAPMQDFLVGSGAFRFRG